MVVSGKLFDTRNIFGDGHGTSDMSTTIFQIRTVMDGYNSGRTYSFRASTPTEAKEWVTAINATKIAGRGGSSLSPYRPNAMSGIDFCSRLGQTQSIPGGAGRRTADHGAQGSPFFNVWRVRCAKSRADTPVMLQPGGALDDGRCHRAQLCAVRCQHAGQSGTHRRSSREETNDAWN